MCPPLRSHSSAQEPNERAISPSLQFQLISTTVRSTSCESFPLVPISGTGPRKLSHRIIWDLLLLLFVSNEATVSLRGVLLVLPKHTLFGPGLSCTDVPGSALNYCRSQSLELGHVAAFHLIFKRLTHVRWW